MPYVEVITLIIAPVHPVGCRAGLAEIRLAEDVALWLEPGFLVVVVRQLAVCRLRSVLRGRLVAMDVHPEKLSPQHGLSAAQSELCHRHVFGCLVFSRNGALPPLGGLPADYGRLHTDCQVIIEILFKYISERASRYLPPRSEISSIVLEDIFYRAGRYLLPQLVNIAGKAG